MINGDIIENKALIDEIVDLTSSVVKINRNEVKIDNWIRIDADNEMNIDALSIAAYGTPDAFDLLCKFNGISNPLSIKTDDIIAIPNLNSLLANMKKLNPKSMMLTEKDKSTLSKEIESTSKSPSKKSQRGQSVSLSKDGILTF